MKNRLPAIPYADLSQTVYLRFTKMISSGLKPIFKDAFKKSIDKDRLKTRFTELIDGGLNADRF